LFEPFEINAGDGASKPPPSPLRGDVHAGLPGRSLESAGIPRQEIGTAAIYPPVSPFESAQSFHRFIAQVESFGPLVDEILISQMRTLVIHAQARAEEAFSVRSRSAENIVRVD